MFPTRCLVFLFVIFHTSDVNGRVRPYYDGNRLPPSSGKYEINLWFDSRSGSGTIPQLHVLSIADIILTATRCPFTMFTIIEIMSRVLTTILKHLRQFVQFDWFLPVFISHG